MATDKEQQIQLQFLEEAQEYLQRIETVLLGISQWGSDRSNLDAALRSAHSIKGGAGMMGFGDLSRLAHRLEDFFKVLRSGKGGGEGELEQRLLKAVDCLRQVVQYHRQLQYPPQTWLATQVEPLFAALHTELGDPQPLDEASLLTDASAAEMQALLFESEVEGCLANLEDQLQSEDTEALWTAFHAAALELAGLGEMLELPAFSSLCTSISQVLERQPEAIPQLAPEILQHWRRSQALVLTGQIDGLPRVFRPDLLSGSDLPLPSLPEALPKPLTLTAVEALPEILPEEFNISESPEVLPNALPEELTGAWFTEALPPDLTPAGSPEVLPEELSAALPDLLSEELTAAWAEEGLDFLPLLDAALPEPVVLPLPEPAVTVGRPEVGEPQFLHKPTSDPIVRAVPSETLSQAAKPNAAVQEQTIRVAVKHLDSLNDLFGELTIERHGLNLELGRLRQLITQLGQKVRVLEQANFRLRMTSDRVPTQAVSHLSIPVTSLPFHTGTDSHQLIEDSLPGFDLLEFDRYSDLHLLSQEVMETIVQIQEISSDIEINLEETESTARQLTRTGKQMQRSITEIRMRPFADLVEPFPRLLRELALTHQKPVQLEIQGKGTLLDRTVLEALRDPLLHLLRNAFDHGIEPVQERRQTGKPETGTITLTALHLGNQTLISIQDDGRGIDLGKVRQRAIEMGVDEVTLASATDRQLLDLIFEPGFSTATTVTDLSGRGVGLDIVRTNLKNVRGDLQLETRPGRGSTFTITVPFTLSVVRVLLVESQGTLLAFPTDTIAEMLLMQSEQVLNLGNNRVLNWDGYMVPLISLPQWLHYTQPPAAVVAETLPVINEPAILLVNQGNDLVGILIDRYWGEQEVTLRPLEGTVPLPPGFMGCTVLGDGRIVPLMDALGLLRWIADQEGRATTDMRSEGITPELTPPLPSSHRPGGTAKPTLMVVDDSVNVRRFLALMLEKAGYQVEQAKDGLEALEKLQAGLAVKAVICDIEMPRLDGYGFLAHIKSVEGCEQVPVLMLTSRSGDKHRQLALRLGAAAYFSKPFREPELLATLEHLIQSSPEV